MRCGGPVLRACKNAEKMPMREEKCMHFATWQSSQGQLSSPRPTRPSSSSWRTAKASRRGRGRPCRTSGFGARPMEGGSHPPNPLVFKGLERACHGSTFERHKMGRQIKRATSHSARSCREPAKKNSARAGDRVAGRHWWLQCRALKRKWTRSMALPPKRTTTLCSLYLPQPQPQLRGRSRLPRRSLTTMPSPRESRRPCATSIPCVRAGSHASVSTAKRLTRSKSAVARHLLTLFGPTLQGTPPCANCGDLTRGFHLLLDKPMCERCCLNERGCELIALNVAKKLFDVSDDKLHGLRGLKAHDSFNYGTRKPPTTVVVLEHLLRAVLGPEIPASDLYARGLGLLLLGWVGSMVPMARGSCGGPETRSTRARDVTWPRWTSQI